MCAGLCAECAALDEEQAVYGLDSREELQLHPIIERSLQCAGYGVHREIRFPATRNQRRKSEGERCDFVLTPDQRPLRETGADVTLFDPADAVDLDDAFWLETKIVSQFRELGPNRQYASQLLSSVQRDARKLSSDRGVLHAGVLLILFVESKAVADHDLSVWQDRALDKGVPIAAPSRRDIPINNRMGHAHCTAAIYPIK